MTTIVLVMVCAGLALLAWRALVNRARRARRLNRYAEQFGRCRKKAETDEQLRAWLIRYIQRGPCAVTVDDLLDLFAEGSGIPRHWIGLRHDHPGVLVFVLPPWPLVSSARIKRGLETAIHHAPVTICFGYERHSLFGGNK